MIKLVASDIDGTLLAEGTMQINEELFTIIRKLKEKGITFMASSGRSMESIESLFAPVLDDIYMSSENGSFVKYKGKILNKVSLNRKAAEEFIRSVRGIPNLTISATVEDMMYIEGHNEELYDHVVNDYDTNATMVDDILEIKEDFVKISLFREGTIHEIADPLIKEWEDRMHVMVAGSSWLDLVGLEADKGNALKYLQEKLGIKSEETMAFGDNCNDIGMLLQAGESYAVANAKQEVKDVAKHVAKSNIENGVAEVLSQLI